MSCENKLNTRERLEYYYQDVGPLSKRYVDLSKTNKIFLTEDHKGILKWYIFFSFE